MSVLIETLGELFDAWMKRDMPHIERVVCIFRARHFLTIWQFNIVNAETRYPDLFQKQSSFLADLSFQILMCLADQSILLLLTHLEYYPNIPFMLAAPIFWSTSMTLRAPSFRISRLANSSRCTNIFSFASAFFLWQYTMKKEKDLNKGYTFGFVDSGLKPEEIAALKNILSRQDINQACETAWKERCHCNAVWQKAGPNSSTQKHRHSPSIPGGEPDS
jgi:hypothetical protein